MHGTHLLPDTIQIDETRMQNEGKYDHESNSSRFTYKFSSIFKNRDYSIA